MQWISYTKKLSSLHGKFSKYKPARNSLSDLHRAKRAYFSDLNPKNLKSSGKPWIILTKASAQILLWVMVMQLHVQTHTLDENKRPKFLFLLLLQLVTLTPGSNSYHNLKSPQRKFCLMMKSTSFYPPWMSQKPMAGVGFLLEHWNICTATSITPYKTL